MVEDRLPIVKVGMEGNEVPGRHGAQQDVGDVPHPVQRAGKAGTRTFGSRSTRNRQNHLFPRPWRMMSLGVPPDHRGARVGLDVPAGRAVCNARRAT